MILKFKFYFIFKPFIKNLPTKPDADFSHPAKIKKIKKKKLCIIINYLCLHAVCRQDQVDYLIPHIRSLL